MLTQTWETAFFRRISRVKCLLIENKPILSNHNKHFKALKHILSIKLTIKDCGLVSRVTVSPYVPLSARPPIPIIYMKTTFADTTLCCTGFCRYIQGKSNKSFLSSNSRFHGV